MTSGLLDEDFESRDGWETIANEQGDTQSEGPRRQQLSLLRNTILKEDVEKGIAQILGDKFVVTELKLIRAWEASPSTPLREQHVHKDIAADNVAFSDNRVDIVSCLIAVDAAIPIDVIAGGYQPQWSLHERDAFEIGFKREVRMCLVRSLYNILSFITCIVRYFMYVRRLFHVVEMHWYGGQTCLIGVRVWRNAI